MMSADGLFVWPLKQAVHLAPGVVVQLDLADAELVGFLVAGVLGDLSDGLWRQFQIFVKVHEQSHVMLLGLACAGLAGNPGRRRAVRRAQESDGGAWRAHAWLRRLR